MTLCKEELLGGGSRISGMWVYAYKEVEVRFADFVSFFLEREREKEKERERDAVAVQGVNTP